jgi:RND family efflux transporter MFP subunit
MYSFTVCPPGCVLMIASVFALVGCAPGTSAPPPAAPTMVSVSYPVEREVTDYADFTARIAAVDSVEVRAHVWGYLDKVNFQEGSLVKKGDVLFELDPRSYQATYDANKAIVAQNTAGVELARRNNVRVQSLSSAKAPAISQAEVDQDQYQLDQAVAALQQSRANLETARNNLDWTKVTAPVSGRVSRYFVTVGNMIQSPDQASVTMLTTIVSVDPMYAYFDVDERTVQRVSKMIREGKCRSASDTAWPVALGLATEQGFPHQGTINFVDNQMNSKTGTLRFRGVFPNKDESLAPGYFARVRLPIGPPHRALLVSDRALDTDQGQKILYVVNNNYEVVSRPVRLGALHDGLRAIEDGLKPGERVIVNGLQLVRPGIKVEPKLVEMPTSQGSSQGSGCGSETSMAGTGKAAP